MGLDSMRFKLTDVVSKPDEVKEKRITGKIIKLSDKGWGFIVSKDIPFTRIFFHWTSLLQETSHFTELRKGDEVEFTPVEVEGRGYRAIKIDVLEPGNEGDDSLRIMDDSK